MASSQDLLHSFARPLVPARFVGRPHRFAVRCTLDAGEPAEEVEAHMADPGRLIDVLVPGRRLLLDGPSPPPRKLAWSVVLADVDGVWISLVARLANTLFPAMLRRDVFPEIATAEALESLRAEVRWGESRLDFLVGVGGERVWVEVKAMELRVGERAMWPDAPSARGLRHLNELRRLVAEGERAAVVFIAGRGDVHSFAPAAHIDPDFAEALVAAAAEGVEVYAARASLSPEGASAPCRLAVELEPAPS